MVNNKRMKTVILRSALALSILGFAGIGVASIPKQTGPIGEAVRLFWTPIV